MRIKKAKAIEITTDDFSIVVKIISEKGSGEVSRVLRNIAESLESSNVQEEELV